MLLTGQKEQWRWEKSSKTTKTEEKANNTNDRKSGDRRFEASVNRKSHTISCANKTARNPARNTSLSHLFFALSRQLFFDFLQAKMKRSFSRIFAAKSKVFRPFQRCDFLHTNRQAFLGEYGVLEGNNVSAIVSIFPIFDTNPVLFSPLLFISTGQ